MAAIRPLHDDYADDQALEGEITSPSLPVTFPSQTHIPMPQRPKSEIRPAGFLGLGNNRQDQEHTNALIAIQQLKDERDYAQASALYSDLLGIRNSGQAISRLEAIARAMDPESTAAKAVAAMGTNFVAKTMQRQDAYSDIQDAALLNILQRRRPI